MLKTIKDAVEEVTGLKINKIHKAEGVRYG